MLLHQNPSENYVFHNIELYNTCQIIIAFLNFLEFEVQLNLVVMKKSSWLVQYSMKWINKQNSAIS
jgi:hypothetical protein